VRSAARSLGGIRKHEQVQTSEEKQDEWEHRPEAQQVHVLLPCHGDDVDDDGQRKGVDSLRWVCRIYLFQFNGTSSENEPGAEQDALAEGGSLVLVSVSGSPSVAK